MVESHVVASTWSTAAQMCFLLAWIMASWITGRLAPQVNQENPTIARIIAIAVSLLVIAVAWMQKLLIVSRSEIENMIQQSRESAHLPPLASTQLMQLGPQTYWSIWLLIALAISCAALQIADSVLRPGYNRTNRLIYAGFFLTWLCGIGLTGASAWLNQQSPDLLRSGQLTIVTLNLVFGITVAAFFIFIHRQRKAA